MSNIQAVDKPSTTTHTLQSLRHNDGNRPREFH